MRKVRLDSLKEGDTFYTSFKYKLKSTAKRCDSFLVLKFRRNNIKCLALNYKEADLFYFPKNKEVLITDFQKEIK